MPISVKRWIDVDETAVEMLARVSTVRSVLLLPPPLHRLPLRVGNVVELVGPSPSAKTLISIQAAINMILPNEWNGIHYGGMERSVMFIDLDCRFNILCLSEMLKHRILDLNGSMNKMIQKQKDIDMHNCDARRKPNFPCDEELYSLCMRRFLYVRCYDSFEFLATLKTLHYQLQKNKEVEHSNIHLLVIDSIGAFHWVDRASSFLPVEVTNRSHSVLRFLLDKKTGINWATKRQRRKQAMLRVRGETGKSLSLQSEFESVVQELRKLLQVHPMLIIATKVTSFGDRTFANDASRRNSFPDTLDTRNVASNARQLPYQEYMPSVWQSFVTHRVRVQASDDHCTMVDHQNQSLYFSEWLLPSLGFLDKFVVKDGGVLAQVTAST